MKSNIIIILTVLLLIAGVVIYLLIRERSITQRDRKLEAREFRLKSAEQLQEIATRDSATSGRIKQLQKDSLSHAAVQGSLRSQIRAFRVKLQNLPPAVHDTLIVLQDSLIEDLSTERDTIYLVNTAVIDSLQKSKNDLHELLKAEYLENVKLQGKVDRERKKRFSFGPHAGYGFRGADVGVSVQYTLLRF